MSTAIATNPMPTRSRPAPLPAVCEALARQLRGAGLCLILLESDGSLAWHDAGAGVFFERYVIPLLRHPELGGDHLGRHLRSLEPSSGQVWSFVPGVALCAAPIVERRQVGGILMLAGKEPDFAIDEDVLRVCSRIGMDSEYLAQQAAHVPAHGRDRLPTSLDMAQLMLADKMRLSRLEGELTSLSSQLANTYEELALIDQISGGMRVNRRAAEFFRQACLDVQQVIRVRGIGVAVNCEGYRLDPVMYGELSLPPGHVGRLADHLLSAMRTSSKCILVNDLAREKGLAWLSEWATQLIAVPLVRQERVLGCIFALEKTGGEFDSVDSKLLTSIANESAIYLENAILYADVHDLMMGLLHSLTSAVDAKDAYTCGHTERVALLSRMLAQRSGLDEAQVERIYMAGLLHDLGKIGVPESVLQKAGRLTAEETELMRRHPQIGARILADVKQMEDIIPGVLCHHERYDGRGYPAGLAGQDIPLMGRIICLADCFDAMTSNRTYRKALPLEVAINEIRRCAGTQFDPALAEAMLRIPSDQFRTLLRDHAAQSKKLLELQQAIRSA